MLLAQWHKHLQLGSTESKPVIMDGGSFAEAQGSDVFEADTNKQTVCVFMSPLRHGLMRSDP